MMLAMIFVAIIYAKQSIERSILLHSFSFRRTNNSERRSI